jgi:hypothetical protein
MQALCYFCRKWFHVECLQAATGDHAKEIREKKWQCQAPPILLHNAMKTMRRGYPYKLEGSYARTYQAQSILSAYKRGQNERLEAWVEKYGSETWDMEEENLDTDLYLCPACGYVL